jgi:colanic acid/amylovoran biosynthesis glycosyltransferase
MSAESDKPAVALWRNNFLPYSETFIHEQIRSHERYRIVVFCRQRRNAALFPHAPTIALEEIPHGGSRLASLWYGAVGASPRFDREIVRNDVRIVHAHFGHNGAFALPFARKHGLPLVVSLHGRDVTALGSMERFLPSRWQYMLRRTALFDYTAAFLAASSELKELIVAAGCPPRKVIVHRLGVDLDRFAPCAHGEDNGRLPLVVMIGRFVEKKGHEYGIHAFASVVREGLRARMIIVGDGPLHGSYERLVGELGIGGSVDLPGALSHNDVRSLLSRATVVLAPSVVARGGDRESGLIVAKEAAACAIPVIGTSHGGIPEIVEDGETGFLVPERDAEALGAWLRAILRSPELGRRLGTAARRKMEREYDIKRQVSDLEAIYDAAIAWRAPGSRREAINRCAS